MSSQLGRKIKNVKVSIDDESRAMLKDLSGKQGLILYFYPRDNTPGCSTEALDFQSQLARFRKAGYAVVGVSADSVKSHQRFIQKKQLEFTLISDTDLQLCNAFAVYGEKKFMGKTHMGIHRRTFILDPSLKVIKEYLQVRVKDHVQTVLADLGLQGAV
ncbi:MAG: peroxiredoxin [Leptospiraceae bacterium]|nr:peroxiredoxin [Leptospiraceae bacterium]